MPVNVPTTKLNNGLEMPLFGLGTYTVCEFLFYRISVIIIILSKIIIVGWR